MEEEFRIFKKFSSPGQALKVQDILNEVGIETEIGNNIPPVDVTFTGNTLMDETEIRIKESDFQRASRALEEIAESEIENLPPDYYLFEFSDEELYEILLKPDEWNELDYMLAQKLLTKNGKSIDNNLLNALRKDRLDDLAKPERSNKAWIAVGYLFAVTGGLLGMLIGYLLWTTKKTLPNGQKVFAYNESDRTQGKIIFFIGIIIFPIVIMLKILS